VHFAIEADVRPAASLHAFRDAAKDLVLPQAMPIQPLLLRIDALEQAGRGAGKSLDLARSGALAG
jgi:hypothetical protein